MLNFEIYSLLLILDHLQNSSVLTVTLNSQKIEKFQNDYEKIYQSTMDRLVDYMQLQSNDHQALTKNKLSSVRSLTLMTKTSSIHSCLLVKAEQMTSLISYPQLTLIHLASISLINLTSSTT